MSKQQFNALLIRVVVTFVEGFVGAWSISNFVVSKGAIGGAIASAASVVYNLIIKPQLEKLETVSGA